MNPPAQRSLALSVAANVVLVSVDVAKTVLGVDAESVSAQLDEGRFRWVWDFATPGSARRELRFWVAELTGGGANSPMDQAIAAVIGSTPGGRQRAAAIEVRWSLSAQLTIHLVRAGCLAEDRVGHARYLRRDSLETFLRSRLIQ